jgi:pseudouridine-5'-monophosphatase
LFSAVVTGDDPRLAEGKPAPDIFLLAAADLGAQPSGCLVVEDSPAGVEAALRAGMQVIALPDAAMEPGVFAGADLVIGGFDEIVPADLGLAPTS